MLYTTIPESTRVQYICRCIHDVISYCRNRNRIYAITMSTIFIVLSLRHQNPVISVMCMSNAYLVCQFVGSELQKRKSIHNKGLYKEDHQQCREDEASL